MNIHISSGGSIDLAETGAATPKTYRKYGKSADSSPQLIANENR